MPSELLLDLPSADHLSATITRPPSHTPVRGGLILIHEIWGLQPHILDVAQRWSDEGYVVITPDLLGKVGITAHLGQELADIEHHPDPQVRSDGQPRLREAMAPSRAPEFAAWAVTALRACVTYLSEDEDVAGSVAVTGFCFGGTFSFALAAADPRVRAVVSYYGTAPSSPQLEAIRVPILALYGAHDTRLMAPLPDVVSAFADADADFTHVVYEHAGHGFFNDTNPYAYCADEATDSWTRSTAFFARHLNRNERTA